MSYTAARHCLVTLKNQQTNYRFLCCHTAQTVFTITTRLFLLCSKNKKKTKLHAYLKRGLHRETEYYSEAVNCTLPDLKSDTCADICYASLFSTTGHFFNLITLKK